MFGSARADDPGRSHECFRHPNLSGNSDIVIPAQAGIQVLVHKLGPGLRRDDGLGGENGFVEY
ncbi:protein of unknown function [Denitratisoma oestradiolicum]|uniref:Uncharacterized protein n=1 Tax=Denitratisoma oestradiolicum TaxID=311182 RepID=A0A6S6XX37_9PROT|nr:protein of unknown function [Denitratisoma oestradiolicum]